MTQPKRCNCTDIPNNSFHKIAAVIVKDGKTLVVKKKGLDLLISLGGKHEQNETDEECLARESLEEINVKVSEPSFLGRFNDATVENISLIVDAYLVQFTGTPTPSNEIEYFLWIGKTYDAKLASVLEKFIIPELSKKGLLQ